MTTREKFVAEQRNEAVMAHEDVCMNELLNFADYLCFDKGKSGTWAEIQYAITKLYNRYYSHGDEYKPGVRDKNVPQNLYNVLLDERFSKYPQVLLNLYKNVVEDKEMSSKIADTCFKFWYATMNGGNGGTNFLMYKGLNKYFREVADTYYGEYADAAKKYVKPYKFLKFIAPRKRGVKNFVYMIVSKRGKVFAIACDFWKTKVVTLNNVEALISK